MILFVLVCCLLLNGWLDVQSYPVLSAQAIMGKIVSKAIAVILLF